MLEITPNVTTCRLTIQLRAVSGGCEADIVYSHTSLGPMGDAFVASFTDEFYRKFMQDWESRINHYLLHGTRCIMLESNRTSNAGNCVHYMIVERFKNRDPVPVYRRFRGRGRLAPPGLQYVSSWVDEKLERCFQLMETSDRRLLDEWIANWTTSSNLISIRSFPRTKQQRRLRHCSHSNSARGEVRCKSTLPTAIVCPALSAHFKYSSPQRREGAGMPPSPRGRPRSHSPSL